jgi:hypothetical protein
MAASISRSQTNAQLFAEMTLQQARDHLQQHPSSLAEKRLVEAAFDQHLIGEKDRSFYRSLYEMHFCCNSLNEKQQNWISEINKRILGLKLL